jgi:hypothetical protein
MIDFSFRLKQRKSRFDVCGARRTQACLPWNSNGCGGVFFNESASATITAPIKSARAVRVDGETEDPFSEV